MMVHSFDRVDVLEQEKLTLFVLVNGFLTAVVLTVLKLMVLPGVSILTDLLPTYALTSSLAGCSVGLIGFCLLVLTSKQSIFRYISVLFFFGLTLGVWFVNSLDAVLLMETGFVLDWSIAEYVLTHPAEVSVLIDGYTFLKLLTLVAVSVVIQWVCFGLFWNLCGATSWLSNLSRRLDFPITGWLSLAGVAFCISVLSLVQFGYDRKDYGQETVVRLVNDFFESESRKLVKEIDALQAPETERVHDEGALKDRNVVIVVLESTRASSTTFQSAQHNITPFLKELGSEGVRAQSAYTMMTRTTKEFIPIYCGIPPRPGMEAFVGAFGTIPVTCLPELLANDGYRTRFFSAVVKDFEYTDRLLETIGYRDAVFLEDYEQQNEYQNINMFGLEDFAILPKLERWLSKLPDSGSPFMASVLTLSPHYPYTRLERFAFQNYTASPDKNRYLNALRYQDKFLEKLFETFKKTGHYEDTLFIITGDHGEGFGEHGRFQHGNVPHNEGIKVPLLVHNADIKTRQIPSEPVNHLAIVPTVLDYLEWDYEKADYPGYSLFDPKTKDYLYFTCWFEDSCMGLIDGDWKYIHYPERPTDELYNLSSDPMEKHNLASEYPDRTKRYRQQTQTYWYRVLAMYGAAPEER